MVLDLAFYEKATREEYRKIVEEVGNGSYEVVLVVFKGSEEVLWGRIEGRRLAQGNGEGEGMSVERAVLGEYIEGFEWPDGEGEVVVLVE